MTHNSHKFYLGMNNLLRILFILGLAFMTIVVHIFIWVFYHRNKYIDQSSLLNIESYLIAQSAYSKYHNTYSSSMEDLGMGGFPPSGIIVHSNNDEEWLKRREVLHIDVQPVVSDQLYRVIFEINNCHSNIKQYWLVEKGKEPLKLKEIKPSEWCTKISL